MLRVRAVALAVGGITAVAWTSLGLTSCSLAQKAASTTTTTSSAVTSTTLIPPGAATPVDSVLPGQCFNQLPDPAQRPFAVLAVGCEVPHLYQVFNRFSYRDANGKAASSRVPYPGETTVRQAAEQECYDNFKPWMGIAWTKSNYDIATWWPTAASWANADRSITCAVFKFTGKTTVGSVANAKK